MNKKINNSKINWINDKLNIEKIRESLKIPKELRIWQFILNKFPIEIEIDQNVLDKLNEQIKNGEKIELNKEFLKHIITLKDFYGIRDEDFIK